MTAQGMPREARRRNGSGPSGLASPVGNRCAQMEQEPKSMTITTVELLAEWERLENAFHDNLPSQGECGDPSHGKALCQFIYDNSDTFRTLISNLVKALEPFAAMGRVMETRAVVTFGKMPPDSEIVCESSGEAGMGILTMGHFRDAAALLPKAPGWGGVYRAPFDRTALRSNLDKEEGDNG